MSMSSEDIKTLAAHLSPLLAHDMKEQHRNFYIEPELHYNDHKEWTSFKKSIAPEDVHELREIIKLFRATKTLWFKSFLGLAIIGTLVVAAMTAVFKH